MSGEQQRSDTSFGVPPINPDTVPASNNDPYEEKRKGRADQRETHIHRIFVGFAYTFAAVVPVVLLVRLWHVVGPEMYHWLNPEALAEIDAVVRYLIGSAFGAAMLNSAKSHLGQSNKDGES